MQPRFGLLVGWLLCVMAGPAVVAWVLAESTYGTPRHLLSALAVSQVLALLVSNPAGWKRPQPTEPSPAGSAMEIGRGCVRLLVLVACATPFAAFCARLSAAWWVTVVLLQLLVGTIGIGLVVLCHAVGPRSSFLVAMLLSLGPLAIGYLGDVFARPVPPSVWQVSPLVTATQVAQGAGFDGARVQAALWLLVVPVAAMLLRRRTAVKFLLVPCVLLGTLGLHAEEAASPLSVKIVQAGHQGTFAPGTWCPFVFDVSTDSRPFRGEVRLSYEPRTTVVHEIELSPRQMRRITLYAIFDTGSPQGKIQLADAAGEIVYEQSLPPELRALLPNQRLVAVEEGFLPRFQEQAERFGFGAEDIFIPWKLSAPLELPLLMGLTELVLPSGWLHLPTVLGWDTVFRAWQEVGGVLTVIDAATPPVAHPSARLRNPQGSVDPQAYRVARLPVWPRGVRRRLGEGLALLFGCVLFLHGFLRFFGAKDAKSAWMEMGGNLVLAVLFAGALADEIGQQRLVVEEAQPLETGTEEPGWTLRERLTVLRALDDRGPLEVEASGFVRPLWFDPQDPRPVRRELDQTPGRLGARIWLPQGRVLCLEDIWVERRRSPVEVQPEARDSKSRRWAVVNRGLVPLRDLRWVPARRSPEGEGGTRENVMHRQELRPLESWLLSETESRGDPPGRSYRIVQARQAYVERSLERLRQASPDAAGFLFAWEDIQAQAVEQRLGFEHVGLLWTRVVGAGE